MEERPGTRAACREEAAWQRTAPQIRKTNVLYADTHVKYHRFTGRVSSKLGGIGGKCMENWWAEHNWEGYYD